MSRIDPVSQIDATGTPDATTYLRGDGSWATPTVGGSSAVVADADWVNPAGVVDHTGSAFTDMHPANTASVTLTTSGGDVIVTLGVTCYRTATGNFELGVRVDGTTDYTVVKSAFNTSNVHQGWTGIRKITGLAAGSHTFTLRVNPLGGTIRIDANDSLSLSAIET